MKAIFENETASLIIGIGKGNTLDIQGVELSVSEAYKLQIYISTCIQEIENSERLKIPFWKRFL
jgi:hypothetical protein